MSEPIKQIFRFILFILVQSLALKQYATTAPIYYTIPLFFVYFMASFFAGRGWVLVLGFLTGFTLDIFTHTPGLHASACLVVAYIRPFLINLLVPRETKELTLGSPGIRSMGFASYFLYVVVLTLFHHGWLIFLEWMSFGNWIYFLGKVFFSSLVSLLLVLITEMLFRPTRK